MRQHSSVLRLLHFPCLGRADVLSLPGLPWGPGWTWRPRDSHAGPKRLPHLAPHGGSGPSQQLPEAAGPRILCRGKRVSVRLWGGSWVPEGWSSFAEKSVGKGNPREMLRRRPGPGCGGGSALPHRHPHVQLLFNPQWRPTLSSLTDWQNARLPCPPLSPGVCPDSCPQVMPYSHLILSRPLSSCF